LRQAVFQINGPAGGLTSATGNATIAASPDDYQYAVYGYDVAMSGAGRHEFNHGIVLRYVTHS